MSTPNGFDQLWIEAINTVLGERETPVRIKDLDPALWDAFIGPMIDAIEDGLIPDSFTGLELDRESYATHPSDICEYPECDRIRRQGEDRCDFHFLLRQQSLGEPVTEKEIETAFLSD